MRRRQNRFDAAGEGAIDGFIATAPAVSAEGYAECRLVVSRSGGGGERLFQAHRSFPIMHIVGVAALAGRASSLAAGRRVQSLRAVEESGPRFCCNDTSATKVTLPFVEERLGEARALMGEDFWSYGLSANRNALETFLRPTIRRAVVAAGDAGGNVPPGTHESFKL